MNIWKVKKADLDEMLKAQIEDACKLFIADRLTPNPFDNENLDKLYNLLKVRADVLADYPEDSLDKGEP